MKKILFAALALIVMMASCVKDPIYPGINITGLSFNPTPQANVSVPVKATITSFKDFTAKLYYNVNDGEYTGLDMTPGANNLYTATIPGFDNDVAVKFYIEASGEGTLLAKTEVKEYVVGAQAVDYGGLRLNELNGQDGKKFIEIYNSGANPINMKGVYIVKDSKKTVWTGVEEINVDPSEYLVLRSEDVQADFPELDTIYIFHSGLSAKKNVRIELYTPGGETIDDFNLVDIDQNGQEYGYANSAAPDSYSRNADGQWYYSEETPGAANIDGANPVLGTEGGPVVANYKNLVLNELNGCDGAKYIEFYNKGNLPLSMEGMYLTKDGVEDDIKWTGDATHVVPAHGYLVLYSEDVMANHEDLPENMFFHSGLSPKKTVRIALYMPDNTERDVFERGSGEWGKKISDVSPKAYTRTPDGGDWKLADPSEGIANPETGDDIPQE